MRYKTADLAPRTIASYQSDFRTFQAWCQAAGRVALPASADTVELYVTDLIGRGRKITTAERHAMGIKHAHREAGQASPCGAGFGELLAGARRTLCQMPAQKEAIGLADLKAMVKATGGGSPIALRDSALLLFGLAQTTRAAESPVVFARSGQKATLAMGGQSDEENSLVILTTTGQRWGEPILVRHGTAELVALTTALAGSSDSADIK